MKDFPEKKKKKKKRQTKPNQTKTQKTPEVNGIHQTRTQDPLARVACHIHILCFVHRGSVRPHMGRQIANHIKGHATEYLILDSKT